MESWTKTGTWSSDLQDPVETTHKKIGADGADSKLIIQFFKVLSQI